MTTREEIIEEIYKVVENLGGKSDILSTIGSWQDNLIPDEQILMMLKGWNNRKKWQ